LRSERTVILAAVVLLHVAFWLLLVIKRSEVRDERAVTVFVVPSAITPVAPEEPGTRPPSRGERVERPGRRSAPSRSHPPQPEPLPSSVEPPLRAPDWAQEAGVVAKERSREQGEADRRARALSSLYRHLPAPPVQGPAFGWDHSSIHRVEPMAGGGTVIHINDQCPFAIFSSYPEIRLYAACALARIGSRGDLFEHLHDPPQPGPSK
jgi:hypothetical protein